jgi:hypothetical protein
MEKTMKPIWTEATPQRGYTGWPTDAEYEALRNAKNMALQGINSGICNCGKNCKNCPGWAIEVFGERYKGTVIKKHAWVDIARNRYGFVSAIYVNDCAATGTGSGHTDIMKRWDGVPFRADLHAVEEPISVIRQRRVHIHHAPDVYIDHPPTHTRPVTLFGMRVR